MSRWDANPIDQYDRIDITGISTSGVHGLYPDEALDAQPFVVDVTIWTTFDEAARSDRLESTIDYVAASGVVQHVVETSRALLIERLADEICNALLANDLAVAVKVTVHKPRAARDSRAADVSISLTRAR
ncbi:MAG: dihydroneopterin aldolase [Propionibacteriaceae bacterium]